MVLHVLNSPTGGAVLSTLGLIDQFARRGIRSAIVCDTGGIFGDRQMVADAVDGRIVFTKLYWTNRKIRSALWKRPLIELRQLVQTNFRRQSTAAVVQAAQEFAADLIHSNTIVTSEGGFAAARLGLPHVWHVRELIGPGKPIRLPFEGSKFGPYVARYSSKLIANSEVTASLIRNIVPAGLLELVPNGIDLSRFTPRARQLPAGWLSAWWPTRPAA